MITLFLSNSPNYMSEQLKMSLEKSDTDLFKCEQKSTIEHDNTHNDDAGSDESTTEEAYINLCDDMVRQIVKIEKNNIEDDKDDSPQNTIVEIFDKRVDIKAVQETHEVLRLKCEDSYSQKCQTNLCATKRMHLGRPTRMHHPADKILRRQRG